MLGRLWPRFARSWRRRPRDAAAEPEALSEAAADEPSRGIALVRGGDRPPRPEEDEAWLGQLAATAAADEEPEVGEPEAVEPEPDPGPTPTAEPQPAEPQAEEPAPDPVVSAPELVAVPEPEPEREPEPEPVVAEVATLPLPVQAQEWNLWELERLSRERGGEDPARDVEWGYLVVYLRDFARPDGTLPTEFDGLVRESFGDLIAARTQ